MEGIPREVCSSPPRAIVAETHQRLEVQIGVLAEITEDRYRALLTAPGVRELVSPDRMSWFQAGLAGPGNS